MEAEDVVEVAVPGLGHDRQAAVERVGQTVGAPGDERVAHRADAIGVGDRHRIEQEAIILDPRRAGHLAVAIEAEPSGEDRREVVPAPGEHHGDTRPNRSLAPDQRSLAADQCGVADGHAGYVGDGIERTRGTVERHAEIARAGGGLLGMGRQRHADGEKGRGQSPAHGVPGARKMK